MTSAKVKNFGQLKNRQRKLSQEKKEKIKVRPTPKTARLPSGSPKLFGLYWAKPLFEVEKNFVLCK